MLNDASAEESLRQEFCDLHFEHKADPVGFVAYFKYKTAASFAEYLGCELPKAPVLESVKMQSSAHNGVLVGGRYYAFYQMMKRRKDERSTRFFYSLLMMKKGLPRPTAEMLAAANREARRVMTTPDERNLSRCMTIESVGLRARKIVRALFHRHDWDNEMMSFPSVAAHYGYSCRDGGALEAVRELLRADEKAPSTAHLGDVVPLINSVDEAIEDETRSPMGLSTAAAAELRDLQRYIVQKALKEPCYCEPVCLPEPLKIRTVTKGPALRYTALAAVQKVLWSQLSQDKRFQIAAPMTGRTVYQLLGRLAPGMKWLSGDYKAATDNLAIELSYHIAQEIADVTGMDASYRELLVDGLVGHVYHMGVGEDGKDLGFLPQARGQLMGSVVSFPILCIANAACIEESLDPDGNEAYLKYIINGDDCLFQCTEEQRQRWALIASEVGLQPSIGKTYFHDRYAVINSALFDTKRILSERQHFEVPGLGWTTDDGPMEYWEAPYLNLGLLLGLKRSGGQSDADGDPTEWRRADFDGDTSIGARAESLVKGWTDGRHELFELFIECNLCFLNGDCRRPWFVPSTLGGWGLPLIGGYVNTQDQLATIARVTRDYPTQVRVRNSYVLSEYRVAVELFQRMHSRTARRTGFKLGKAQMSSLLVTSRWAFTPPVAGCTKRKENCSGTGVYLSSTGRCFRHVRGPHCCPACEERQLDRQVRQLSGFWNRMRTVGQAMALSGELPVLTDGEIDDKKVEDLYYHSLASCESQEEPAYDVLVGAWGVDGFGHVFGDSSFPNWGAHPPPLVYDVWGLPPAAAIELSHVTGL